MNSALFSGTIIEKPVMDNSSKNKRCRFTVLSVIKRTEPFEQAEIICNAEDYIADIVSRYYHEGDEIIFTGRMIFEKFFKDHKEGRRPEVNVGEIRFSGGVKHEEPEHIFIKGLSDIDPDEVNRIFDGLDVPF